MRRIIRILLVMLLPSASTLLKNRWSPFVLVQAAGPSISSLILRIRLPDGSIQKLAISSESADTISLQNAIESVLPNKFDASNLEIRLGTSTSSVEDLTKSLSQLGIKHGFLLTVTEKEKKKNSKSKQQTVLKSSKTDKKSSASLFVPFPDLAKDYESAMRKAKIKRSSGSSSYQSMSDIASSLHTVDPQPAGSVKRIYMCATSAERFQAGCYDTKSRLTENHVGLLLGTIQRERIDLKPRPKTSLSSTILEDEYCTIVKVHAVYEPPNQPSSIATNYYDATSLLQSMKSSSSVLRVADWLGLKPIGWIFTYNDGAEKNGKRNNGDEDALPVLAQDIRTGAQLQIENMKNAVIKYKEEDTGTRFCTLAMDAKTGATEAFQLSDVTVQMIAEDMFVLGNLEAKKKTTKDGVVASRHVTTRYPVFVDGKETKELDSVLCLVNTALLSHKVGLFAGGKTLSVKRKTGASLTTKTKKALLRALDDASSSSSHQQLLELLCDFNLLIALDTVLSTDESKMLCQTVQKWARGQKQSTMLESKLVRKLQTILDN